MPRNATVAVCINAHPKTNVLLHAAANKAKELGKSWAVIYVETPKHYALDQASHKRVLRFLTLAEEMGAKVCHIEHGDVRHAILNFIHESAVKYLIIGRSSREGFFNELRVSMAERITRELRKYKTEVQIIPLSSKPYSPRWFDRLQLQDIKLKEIGFAFIAVFAAYLASEILRASITSGELQLHNVSAFFLIATVISALRYGLVPGLSSAILGFSTINYFYVPPLYSFELDRSGESISLSIFLISAVVISLMGAFSRASHSLLARKERRSQALYKVYRLASEATDRNQAFKILHQELTQLLEMEVAFFLPPAVNPNAIELVYPKEVVFSEKDKQSLLTCWQQVRTTGLGSINHFNSSWRFELLSTPNNELGVMAVKVPPHVHLDASFGQLLSALADQAASILERIDLNQMMSESHMREEREKLRAMLLSSVSHDLKTPLASIIGAMSVYKRIQKGGRLAEETANELIQTALDEAQRLDGFISNILDMTRIESGEILFDKEWVTASKPVKNVQKRLCQRLNHHTLIINAQNDNLEVLMDKIMTEQVLQNVIENATKYSPAETSITLTYGKYNDGFAYHIRDQGPGIPEDKLEAVFDKYERLKQSDSTVAGTGLGLAIAKAIMEKQGGTISVQNHVEGGALFTLWFPAVREFVKDRREAT